MEKALNTTRFTYVFAFVLVALAAAFALVLRIHPAAGVSEDYDFTILPSPWSFVEFLGAPECPEPSGIAYFKPTGEMFIVDDGARDRKPALYKYRVDSSLTRKGESDTTLTLSGKLELGRDLEGVTVDEANNLVYVVEEKDESVYEVDPAAMKLLRTFSVAQKRNGENVYRKGGNGFEGIAWRPMDGAPLGGKFYLANQDDPTCVMRVTLPAKGGQSGGAPAVVKIESVFQGEQINLGDIMWNEAEGTLWLSHAWSNLLEVVDIDNRKTIRWESLPGSAQEGITFDGEGRLWIAQDTGGVAIYARGKQKYY